MKMAAHVAMDEGPVPEDGAAPSPKVMKKKRRGRPLTGDVHASALIYRYVKDAAEICDEMRRDIFAASRRGGSVDITEFAHACKTSVDDERMQTLFALLDEDGGGTLELAEVASVLRNNAEARALAGNFSKLEDLVRLANERRKRKSTRRRPATNMANVPVVAEAFGA